MPAPTNTKEEGFETLIVKYLVEQNGYEEGTNDDYNKEFAVDETRLFRFLQNTQPREIDKQGALKSEAKKREFLNRLKNKIAERGIIDVLRNGLKAYPAELTMFYLTPTESNQRAVENFNKNIFSVTRQLRYSTDAGRLALDLSLFINGLPVATIELKNTLTGQNVEDAVEQYKKDRSPRDTLFSFKRCMAHFAVDDCNIKFCTKLEGKDSWFLPFDKGYNGGAGNPPNPEGIKTDYLWKDIFTKQKLARIIENYAQVIEEENADGNSRSNQVFPRYHQLDVVEKLLADVKQNGIGKRYLIQHSAGSGKSNSIAWLAHQLIAILGNDGRPLIDSVLVVNDRRILDRQTRNTIKRFTQMGHTVEWADSATNLREAIQNSKRIIITTVEKFPFITEGLQGMESRHFAIIIDEAHSGQSGNNAAQMNQVLAGAVVNDANVDIEDKINAMMEGRKLLRNASYFAFTATPKNKTEEIFGEAYQENGITKHRPFHVYSMKQAIDEGFILDVLKNYTPIDSFYKIIKTVDEDPMFDKKRAREKLRAFVEGDHRTIEKKAAMIVEHFHEQVISHGKINGQARAMVVTASIARCVEYYYAIKKLLEERNSPYKAIVAFSGDHKFRGAEPPLTSAGINEFSDLEIPKKFKEHPYRILVVADMFQTGFDEPLLHTMYVDKPLTDIKAVQTLSRLNRCCPGKRDTFVLDFANKAKDIEDAFSKYYSTTILSGETDPNKLNDLVDTLEKHRVYTNEDVGSIVEKFLGGAGRETLDPILDACAKKYKELEEDAQVEFKGSAKAFVRTYNFLGAILPYGNAAWEKLSIFLNLLIPKLPSPREDDLSAEILSAVELDSYRNEVRETISIKLSDEVSEILPFPANKAAHIDVPEMDPLTQIITEFNDRFGDIQWNDADNVRRQISQLPAMVAKDERYQNAIKNSDEQNAKLESARALNAVILGTMKDNMELYKQFYSNPSFREWLLNMVFNETFTQKYKLRDEAVKTA